MSYILVPACFFEFCHHVSPSNSDQPCGCCPLASASSVAGMTAPRHQDLHFLFSRKVLTCLEPSVSSSDYGTNTVFPFIPSYKAHTLSTFILVCRRQQTQTPVWGLVGGISQGLTHCQALPLTRELYWVSTQACSRRERPWKMWWQCGRREGGKKGTKSNI